MKKLFQLLLCLTMIFGYSMVHASSNPANFDFNTKGKLSSDINATFSGLDNNFSISSAGSSDSQLTLRWTGQVGESKGNTYATGVSADKNGNIYVAGYTTVALFGNKQTGNKDYFIAKYDQFKNLVWIKQVGASGGTTIAQGVSTDNNGNVYVAGYTDSGLSGQTQTGINDYFIARYDQAGNLIWSRQVGGTCGFHCLGNTYAHGVSSDSNGNIYVVGYTDIGISGQKQNGDIDYFIAKYDQSGNLTWSKQIGALNGDTYATEVSADSNGNIYVVGYTDRGISGQKQQGNKDYFIAKYDQTGNLIWSKQVGASGGNTEAYGVSADSNGDIYIAGFTNTGISGQIQNGSINYFIAKYDQNGNLIWTRQVGNNNCVVSCSTEATGVSADNSGNIYVAGYTNTGISGENQNGVIDYFIAQYDQSGNLISTKQVGVKNGSTTSTGVSADSLGNIYVAGYTNAGISFQQQNGKNDYFIAKYVDTKSVSFLKWTEQNGVLGGDIEGYGISADNNGNNYVVGKTNRAMSGQVQQGVYDYFIAKYDQNSNLIWNRQVGATNGNTFAYGVSSDNNGNIYVAGYTTVGISGQTQTGKEDYFLAKYDQSGNLIWTRQVGVKNGNTYATGVSADSNGNVYIAGYTDKGISGQIQTGNKDYFIAKYDQSGNLIWSKQVGASGGDTEANGVSVDSNGDVYIAGFTNKGISGNKQTGNKDYFIVKYDQAGNLIQSKQVGVANGNALARGVSADNNGNVYVAGYTNKGISGQIQNGQEDYFIVKYDQSENLVWTRQVGNTNGFTYANGVSADNNGNVYVAGYTTVGINGQSQTGYEDYFIARYDKDGNQNGSLIYAEQSGSLGGYTEANGISANSNGDIYITGYTTVGINGQSQTGIADYFVAQYVN